LYGDKKELIVMMTTHTKPEAIAILKELNTKPVSEQAKVLFYLVVTHNKTFLRTFVLDFKGNFEG
jgi:hypothetical protein